MRLMFDSTYTNFLDLYSPNITFIDEGRICEDSLAVNWLLDETGLTIQDLKQEVGLKANKNHVSIPPGTNAKVLSMNSGPDNTTILQINGYKIFCFMNKDADFCVVEVEPLNKEFEKAFSSTNIPSKKDNIQLYGIDVCDLVAAINHEYKLDSKIKAYEELKCTPKKNVLSYYDRYKTAQIIDYNLKHPHTDMF